jgi:hypothetical protein
MLVNSEWDTIELTSFFSQKTLASGCFDEETCDVTDGYVYNQLMPNSHPEQVSSSLTLQ